jgi:glutamate dehydrogenase/leucine dehydrogenase
VGGTAVSSFGNGFTGATAVKFGTTSGTSLVVVSDALITVVSPAGSAGVVDVTVTTPLGTSATTTADQFTYGVAVTSLSPTSGPVAGGTSVTITGSGFTGATAVNFGATPGTSLVIVSDTSITITTPALTGVVDVTVVTPVGTSPTSSADQFAFVSASTPVVTRLGTSRGPTVGGTTVSILGSGFTGATVVKFGTTSGTSLAVVSDALITVVSPAGSAGLAHVTVTTPGGTSRPTAADLFQYTLASSKSGRKWFGGLGLPTARLTR